MAQNRDGKGKGKHPGTPLFDQDTRDNIAREAITSRNKTDVARKYGTNPTQVHRYIRALKRREAVPAAPAIPSDLAPAREVVAGAECRRDPKDVQRILELEQDNRILYEVLGRMAVESFVKKP